MRREIAGEEKKIIWRADLLSDQYLPEQVIGREEQRRKLEMCLSPMKHGQAPLNAWLYGPAGTGKTVLARSVVAEICPDSSARFAFYVNCWERRSLYQVVRAIAESLKVLGGDAQDTNVKLDRISQTVKERPVLVILDDIDRIAPIDRNHIIPTILGLPYAGVICISNRKETLLSLEERTRSRLSPVVVSFLPYRPRELEEILMHRARDALGPDTWDKAVLVRIAQRGKGDARAAILGLRQAALVAESVGREKLTAADISDVLTKSEERQQEGVLSQLSYHQRMIYELARENAPVTTTELREIYTNRCNIKAIRPVAPRTFSKYVNLLEEYGVVTVVPRSARGAKLIIRG